jgi:hypothetical protein
MEDTDKSYIIKAKVNANGLNRFSNSSSVIPSTLENADPSITSGNRLNGIKPASIMNHFEDNREYDKDDVRIRLKNNRKGSNVQNEGLGENFDSSPWLPPSINQVYMSL